MNKAGTAKNEHPSSKSRFLAAATPLAMLAAVTLMTFANAWPDRFVLDDKLFIVPTHGDSLYNIFTKDVWAAAGIDSGLYRPLFMLSLSLETWVFGGWLAGYHLSNIFQHLLVTFLVYGFCRHLLRITSDQPSSSDLYALLAALVFAVHPIHTEVVNSVFNRSEMMVALFGLAGLWWLFHYLDTRPGRAWFGIGIAYFLGLFSKESAAVIPGLAVVLILLLTPGALTTRIRKCLPVFWLFLPLAIYLAMRAYALALPMQGGGDQAAAVGEWATLRATAPGSETFLAVAGILGESLKAIAWPYPLHLYYKQLSTLTLAGYIALHLVLIIASLVQLKRKRYSLAAGLAFFYIAMLPASRLIGMGTPLVAERYLYFPSVGLTITLVFALRALAPRFGPRILLGCGMPVLLVLTALTWERNADWLSEVSLFEAEYQQGNRGESTLRLLTAAHLNARNEARIVEICDENPGKLEEYAASKFVYYYCAVAYEDQRRYKEAEHAYLLAIEHRKTRTDAGVRLARFYLRQGRRQDAEKQFTAVIDSSDDPADKALYQGEMIVTFNRNNRKQVTRARGYIEEALRLRPGWSKAESMLKAVNKVLNSSLNQEIDGDDSGT